MKSIKIFIATVFLFSLTANSQITKGNWMVGGNASFAHGSSNQDSGTSNTLYLSPNIGYFVINKLAFGTLFNYDTTTSKFEDTKNKTISSNLGPFIRYYLLKNEKQINVFVESSYNFSTIKENKNTILAAKTGVAVFLNSSVALEISMKYTHNKFRYNSAYIPDGSSNFFIIGMGIQVHLEKK